MGPEVTIVRTGVANTASVAAALTRRGCRCALSEDASAIERAPVLVLPGVGSFGAGMEALGRLGLREILRARVGRGEPTLAICLGLQLLCVGSDESPGVEGLGVLDARVTRFGPGVRTPQFGWNRVEPEPDARLVEPGFAYFANSYRLEACPEGWTAAWADHGGRFVASVERGGLLACQFHPELSGPWGGALLGRWLARCGVPVGEGSPC